MLQKRAVRPAQDAFQRTRRQVPLDRAGPDDRLRVHAQLPGRVHVPLRHADGARAHRLGHVRHDDRRAARRLSDQGRPRIRGRSRASSTPSPTRRSARSTARRSTCSTATACAPRSRRYTVFNGVHNGMVKQAAAGEARRARAPVRAERRARATPRASTWSARSSTASGSRAIPTTSSAACRPCCSARPNSAIVEFMIPEAGCYVMVDHHFANASQGAIGLISTDGASRRQADLEHHNMPATAAPTRSGSRAGQARVREQVPRLPLDRRRRQARPRSGRRDQAAQRRLADALAEVAREDAETDADAKADAQEVQQCRCRTRT